ncbi:RNA polymerase II elongation factor Ell [Onthophagus taurus]|uniref:RNA polymerase II elongation factor Ell n=1 Tax=Onthophagus taurus TaxID=166361 RepID=UPI0039BDF065
MATLCPGVQYGLSTKENFGENNTLIFMKLTDSAFGAVREHIQHKNEHTACPTIQFLGDQGQLYIPISKNDGKTFKFSVSSTADMEGPGGSFECVQQIGLPRGSLQALGCLPYKIRIHANDDVYETTRKRMTVAEENHKNKCTREIKPNQTDIGRKVKVKQMPGGGGGSGGRPVGPLALRNETSSSSAVRDFVQKSSSQYQLQKPPNLHSTGSGGGGGGGGGFMSNGFGSNHVSSSRVPSNKPSLPDIARRPIKERMIHLLALRPYKKPELFDRLTKEGVRERMAMTTVLKQIAFLKNNEYHLNRSFWNDVKEDWPFYTESEKQILKRRKPQNLTPPGSSDGGSSGSGHSPTSTHPGSPPLPISYPKRPGYFDGNDGLPTKKPRISHYQKTPDNHHRGPNQFRNSSTVENGNGQRRPPTDSRDASNMNPRSRESPTLSYGVLSGEKRSGSGGGGNVGSGSGPGSGSIPGGGGGGGYNSDDDDLVVASNNHGGGTSHHHRKRVCDSHSSVKQQSLGGSGSAGSGSHGGNSNSGNNHGERNVTTNGNSGYGGDRRDRDGRDRDQRDRTSWSNNTVTSTSKIQPPQVSPDSQSERISANENPDYVAEYTTIRNPEQRTRYKQDFKNSYDEYRELHAVVDKVSRRFVELEERLNQVDTKTPMYNDIRRQILREYRQNKNDQQHQQVKRKFEYLHEKLSHIKRLVTEYDQKVAQSSGGGNHRY